MAERLSLTRPCACYVELGNSTPMSDRWCLDAGNDPGLGALVLAPVADMCIPIATEYESFRLSAQCPAGCTSRPASLR
jgi:hypothetical protein